ncbi:hypothetical protein B0T18DRAFT_421203 [Schizothecium vesticola]|uniref:Peptidase S8/S53 domain-containing protein n=1 Tax=Schizothecium vesticola TaxID=314040 RepID=A0AA40BPT9_9PEZI|nr:hypothetical protein B0T18DRAFT_421203 [Schizothecium vesticola]
MEPLGAQLSVVSTVARLLRAFKQPRPATYEDPTNVDLTAQRTNISALAARLVGELIAEAGDDSGELRALSISLSARLCAVAKCLEDVTLPLSNGALLRLDEEILHEIERVVTWPKLSKQFTSRPVEQIRACLRAAINGPRPELKSTIRAFLESAPSALRESIIEICDQIISQAPADQPDVLTREEQENAIPGPTVDNLLAAVSKCALCATEVCAWSAAFPTRQRPRETHHPARLYLGKPHQSGSVTAIFDLFVSSHSHHYWQEIGISLPLYDSDTSCAPEDSLGRKKRVRFEDGDPASLAPIPPLPRRAVSSFCSILERETSARIFLEHSVQDLLETETFEALQHNLDSGKGVPLLQILRHYEIGVPEKIILAFIIARAFWQLYETRMTLARWTHHDVWFMSNGGDNPPCKAYMELPLQDIQEELQEYEKAGLIHKCPRILAVGVLLLEIGLARPMEGCHHPKPNDRYFVRKTNEDHASATRQLDELKGVSWKGYCSKRLFDSAVGNCLNGKNFSPGQGGNLGCSTIAERRAAFYEKVVEPLGLLAGSFPPQRQANITMRNETLRGSTAATAPVQVDEFRPATLAAFHTGRTVNPEEWLEDLRVIGRYLNHVIRRLDASEKTPSPIRVAILDSGCNLQAEYFREQPRRASRVVTWRDFVDQPPSEVERDSCGHGTLMAMLLIDIAPNAELIIGRVAENTTQLEGMEDAISQAIRWAGVDCKADIISMSFGVSDTQGLIHQAILDVRSSRNDEVIFFASAGNLGLHQDEAFPANQDGVTSIRATDHLGVPMGTNPPSDRSQAVSFATFGGAIPLRLKETHPNPNVCQPGSSVSTAVAAGVAATMLGLAAWLPLFFPNIPGVERVSKLKTSAGVRALFEKLSDDVGNRVRFVNPVKFFVNRPENIMKLCAFLDCAAEIR